MFSVASHKDLKKREWEKERERHPCIKNSYSELRTQIMAKSANSVFIQDFRRPPSRQLFPHVTIWCDTPVASLYFVNAANLCPIHIVSIIHRSITIQQIVQRNLPPLPPELVQILPRVGQFRCIKSAWLGSNWIKFRVHYFSIDPKLQDLASTPQFPFFPFTLSAPPSENINNEANHKLTSCFCLI